MSLKSASYIMPPRLPCFLNINKNIALNLETQEFVVSKYVFGII